MPQLSHTAKSILTILHNINELILHNYRKEATDVLRALKVYADNRSFGISEDKFQNFYSVVLDSRPKTLQSLVFDIAQDVIATDKAKG